MESAQAATRAAIVRGQEMSFCLRFGALCLLAAAITPAAPDPREAVFEDHPALLLANDRIQLTVLTQGATIAALTLADDDEQVNPMWNPLRLAREAGRRAAFDGMLGHFVALDGFGDPSREERVSGMQAHGEARLQQYAALPQPAGASASVRMTAILPVAQESFTRTYTVIDGENVVY